MEVLLWWISQKGKKLRKEVCMIYIVEHIWPHRSLVEDSNIFHPIYRFCVCSNPKRQEVVDLCPHEWMVRIILKASEETRAIMRRVSLLCRDQFWSYAEESYYGICKQNSVLSLYSVACRSFFAQCTRGNIMSITQTCQLCCFQTHISPIFFFFSIII